MNDVTPVKVGDAVIFVDAVGKHHHALLTAVWGPFYDTPTWTREQVDEQYASWTRPEYYTDEEWEERKQAQVGMHHTVPSVNVVYVSDDAGEHDPYGNQIKRNTSVVHRTQQSAHGMYWVNI